MGRRIITTVAFAVFLVTTAVSVASATPAIDTKEQAPGMAAVTDYQTIVRLYVVEPVSRWTDRNNAPYEFGFLEFAIDELVTIPADSRTCLNVIWDPAAFGGIDYIVADNVAVQAVMADFANAYKTYPNPADTDRWFWTYEVNAAAMAAPGVPGQNSTSGGYTHTVFLEEGTAHT